MGGGSRRIPNRVKASAAPAVIVNNTNPILVDGSAERRRVEAAGWEIAEDGQEIVL